MFTESHPTHTSLDVHHDLKRDVEELAGIKLSSLVELPTNGLTNRVFAAHSTSGAVVIRVSPPHEFVTYENERICATYAATLGIRTPHVLGAVVSASRAIHISEYIPGTDLNHVDSRGSIEPWKQVGEMIHRLHNATTGDKVLSLERWARAISRYCTTTDSSGVPYHSDKRLAYIGEVCERLSKVTIGTVLCHANVRANNIRVDPQGRAWVLDWGAAIQHSRLMDIADLFAFDATEAARAAFFEGYGEPFDVRDQMLEDIVITKLAAGYVWLEQQAYNPTRSQDSTQYIAESHRVLERLRSYVDCND